MFDKLDFSMVRGSKRSSLYKISKAGRKKIELEKKQVQLNKAKLS